MIIILLQLNIIFKKMKKKINKILEYKEIMIFAYLKFLYRYLKTSYKIIQIQQLKVNFSFILEIFNIC